MWRCILHLRSTDKDAVCPIKAINWGACATKAACGFTPPVVGAVIQTNVTMFGARALQSIHACIPYKLQLQPLMRQVHQAHEQLHGRHMQLDIAAHTRMPT